MNLLKGMKLKVNFPIFSGKYPNSTFEYNVECEILITNDKYTDKGQHNFTFKILSSANESDFMPGSVRRKFGRNLYPNVIKILESPKNSEELARDKWERKMDNKNTHKSIEFFNKNGYFYTP